MYLLKLVFGDSWGHLGPVWGQLKALDLFKNFKISFKIMYRWVGSIPTRFRHNP